MEVDPVIVAAFQTAFANKYTFTAQNLRCSYNAASFRTYSVCRSAITFGGESNLMLIESRHRHGGLPALAPNPESQNFDTQGGA
jgi:hypothetical protein